MAIGNYSNDLIIYYSVVFIIFFMLVKSPLWKRFVTALLLILVGSEYYEIPIFIKGYLYGPTPHILHHFITILLFLLLIGIQQVTWSKPRILLLLSGPLVTTIFFFGFPEQSWYALTLGLGFPDPVWYARAIGSALLFAVVMIKKKMGVVITTFSFYF